MKAKLILPIFLLAFSYCHAGDYDVEVGTFSKIKILGNFKLFLHAGDAEKVHISNNDSIVTDEGIIVEVSKGELSISIKGDNFHVHDKLVVDIWYKSITGIELKRGAWMKFETPVETDSLTLEIGTGGDIVGDVKCRSLFTTISKGGTMRIGGTSTTAKYKIFAGGEVYAPLMVSEDIYVEIRTGGDVTVTGKNILDVLIFSGGKVSYKGNPAKLVQDVKIAGEVKKLDK